MIQLRETATHDADVQYCGKQNHKKSLVQIITKMHQMNKIQYFHTEVKGVEKTEKGTLIKGYASTPTVDRGSDVVEPEAFRHSIAKEYRDNPIILFQHKNDRPIGRVEDMRIDSNGLYVEGVIVDNDIEPKIQAGILGTFSIGYIPKHAEYRDKDGILLDPEKDYMRIWDEEGVTRVIKELDLVEISVVTVPMNPDARFTLSKSVKNYFDLQKKEFLSNNPNDMKNEKDITNKKEDKENVLPPENAEKNSTPEEVTETPTDETAGEAEAAPQALARTAPNCKKGNCLFTWGSMWAGPRAFS